jgi:ribonuclease E
VEAPKRDHDSVPMFAPAEPAPAAPAPVAAAPEPVPAQDDDKPARRRSTVREKVSFASATPAVEPEAVAPVVAAEAPAPVAAPVTSPAPTPDAPAAPRKAGWWSRAFGGGES